MTFPGRSRLAIVGDIHGCWVDADTAYFNRRQHDALLLVGDLPPIVNALPVARRLAQLQLPAFLIPGNHDAGGAAQFLAELRGHRRLAQLLAYGQQGRETVLRAALQPVKLVAYSLEVLDGAGQPLGLIAGRPYSMGGDRLYFSAHLQRSYGIRTFADSAQSLRTLVDAAPQDIVFLSHNGPSGLGEERDAPWGCDFRPQAGDFGDPDLRDAIDYARSQGKRVHAVVAGHMHHRLKGDGAPRRWRSEKDGVLYVNAARVPRIRRRAPGQPRHHVELTLDAGGARAEARWIDEAGEPVPGPAH